MVSLDEMEKLDAAVIEAINLARLSTTSSIAGSVDVASFVRCLAGLLETVGAK